MFGNYQGYPAFFVGTPNITCEMSVLSFRKSNTDCCIYNFLKKYNFGINLKLIIQVGIDHVTFTLLM